MSEHLRYDLPLEIDEQDLRYLMPELFAAYAAEKGWSFAIEENVDGNHYKILYVISRPVPLEFSDEELSLMQDRIGIKDEYGEIIDDYGLWTESGRAWNTNEVIEIEPPNSESKRLYFEFEGFPTDQTMGIIERLTEKEFVEPYAENHNPGANNSRWYRLLGFFGLRNNISY